MTLPEGIIAEMEKSHISPSPGFVGAFGCNICGSTNLGILVNKETGAVAIVCVSCGNHQEFESVKHS